MPRDRGRKYQPIEEAEGWSVDEAKTLRFPIYGEAWAGTPTAEVRLATEEGGANLITWDADVDDPDEDEEALGIGAVVTAEVDDYTGVTGSSSPYWYEVWRTDTGNEGKCVFGPAVIASSIPPEGP